MLASKLTTDIAVVEAERRDEQTSGDAKASPAPESVLETPADAQVQAGRFPGTTNIAGQQRPVLPLLRQKLDRQHRLALVPFLLKKASRVTVASDQAPKDLSDSSCRWENGDIVSMVVVINQKVLLCQLTTGRF